MVVYSSCTQCIEPAVENIAFTIHEQCELVYGTCTLNFKFTTCVLQIYFKYFFIYNALDKTYSSLVLKY